METENVLNKIPIKERKIDEGNELVFNTGRILCMYFKSLNNESCIMKYNFRTAYW